ncbi:MAG: hypothetical protein COY66_01615 [Candidatus Kerfeldbacteria bacterium CG_4_10_14_0_8_um_filter_42_10]|uniref:Type II secretion system protein GspG C-terminal domain-containing protein n=1 Tax=Candidatus Kerfeldbacteria bacterium CG_4_10_14_0_8_um_filter_42_10 TaxID=2014248 RepID=A0A2M7RJX8_9BACT|nr:MAG: hypothetical protein COY66_01615 [Candidatus Kerfeldbacteria bacterium CG_4_10_14_0_8_um_filter_42_10]
MRNKKGFTLIELLVVIAIIGLLATIAVVALNSARTSSRDAKRVADVRQVQTGLEMYFNSQTQYPYGAGCGTYASPVRLSALATAACSPALVPFVTGIGNITDPVSSNTTPCDADTQSNNCDYGYAAPTAPYYVIYFSLEGTSGSFEAGPHTATSAGIL